MMTDKREPQTRLRGALKTGILKVSYERFIRGQIRTTTSTC